MRFAIHFFTLISFFLMLPSTWAWENHEVMTRQILKSWDRWEEVPYEPLEKALKDIRLGGVSFLDRKSLAEYLQIRGDRVDWDAHISASVEAESEALAVLAHSTMTPDQGMDQELNLSPNQEFMGGYHGLSSQGFRHMYYVSWDWRQPLLTFHVPHISSAMGVAPERAQIFFDLAVQAKKTRHMFWAYRFLGMCLHYIEDLNQPYHAHQYGSLVLLPFSKLFSGKKAFLDEATRVVSNFHLSFEQYVEFLQSRNTPEFNEIYHVPRATAVFKNGLESHVELEIHEAAALMARAAAMLASSAVGAQLMLMGEDLERYSLDLGAGFFDGTGRPKIDFLKYEKNIDASKKYQETRKRLLEVMVEALSNTSVSVRWVFDKFRLVQ